MPCDQKKNVALNSGCRDELGQTSENNAPGGIMLNAQTSQMG